MGNQSKNQYKEKYLKKLRLKIELAQIKQKGSVSWHEKDHCFGGMYLFLADVPNDLQFETPVMTEEGILDWKEIDWVIDQRNEGVGECIPNFLPILLTDEKRYHHSFYYEGNRVIEVVVKEQVLV